MADIKIVDFGFARKMPDNQERLLTPCLTFQYAAPEVLQQLHRKDALSSQRQAETQLILRKQEDGYDQSCDLWSLGVILVSLTYSSDDCQVKQTTLLQTSLKSETASACSSFPQLPCAFLVLASWPPAVCNLACLTLHSFFFLFFVRQCTLDLFVPSSSRFHTFSSSF